MKFKKGDIVITTDETFQKGKFLPGNKPGKVLDTEPSKNISAGDRRVRIEGMKGVIVVMHERELQKVRK